jgi:cold shock CspA family protein
MFKKELKVWEGFTEDMETINALVGPSIAKSPRRTNENKPRKFVGVISGYSKAKGYGFIKTAEGDRLFYHHMDIIGDYPREKQLVTYEIGKDHQGRDRALKVEIVKEAK